MCDIFPTCIQVEEIYQEKNIMGKLKITLFAAILFLISFSNSCEAKGRGGGRGRGRGGSVGGGQGKTLRPKTCS